MILGKCMETHSNACLIENVYLCMYKFILLLEKLISVSLEPAVFLCCVWQNLAFVKEVSPLEFLT